MSWQCPHPAPSACPSLWQGVPHAAALSLSLPLFHSHFYDCFNFVCCKQIGGKFDDVVDGRRSFVPFHSARAFPANTLRVATCFPPIPPAPHPSSLSLSLFVPFATLRARVVASLISWFINYSFQKLCSNVCHVSCTLPAAHTPLALPPLYPAAFGN